MIEPKKIKVRVQKKNPYHKFTAEVTELNVSPHTTPVVEIFHTKKDKSVAAVYNSRYELLCKSDSKFSKYEKYFEAVCDSILFSIVNKRIPTVVVIDTDFVEQAKITIPLEGE